MISLPKEKTLKYLGCFLVIVISLIILFSSLVITGLKVMAQNREMDNLRNIPIQYVKKMENGENILKVYKVPESKIGPENKKYLIKKIRDRLWISLSRNPKGKSEVCLLIADKEMYETVELVKNKKNEDLILKTLDEAFLDLKKSKEILIGEDKKDIEIIKINQKISEAGLAYEDIVKSFDYKNEKFNKFINEIENWNQKNIKEEKEK